MSAQYTRWCKSIGEMHGRVNLDIDSGRKGVVNVTVDLWRNMNC